MSVREDLLSECLKFLQEEAPSRDMNILIRRLFLAGAKAGLKMGAKEAKSDNYKMFMKEEDLYSHEIYSKVRKQARNEVANKLLALSKELEEK